LWWRMRKAYDRLVSTPTFLAGAPRPGDVIADKYRVDRILGVGGMGVVVAATHMQLDDRVAIKVLLPELAGEAEVVERFLREGRAAVRIRSEHVGRVLDVGTVCPGGAPCIIMEYLEGQDLDRLLEERGRLTPREAIEYVLQATEAIAEAHKAGIVHRDLKPANLFLTHRADGSVCIKVLDFGIAKMVATGQAPNVTKTRMQMGSPLYMAPEQLRSSRKVDARADIWALGALLHELVDGSPPFHADTLAELAILVATEPAPRLVDRRPDTPPALQAVIDRCLEKEPEKRFDTVATFAEALAPVVDSDLARASARRVTLVLSKPAAREAEAAVAAPEREALAATMAAGPVRGSVTARSWAKTRGVLPRQRPVVAAGVVTVVALGAFLAGRVAMRGAGGAGAAIAPASVAATTQPSQPPLAQPAPASPPAWPSPPAESATVATTAATAPTSSVAPVLRKPAASTKPAASQRPHVEDLH